MSSGCSWCSHRSRTTSSHMAQKLFYSYIIAASVSFLYTRYCEVAQVVHHGGRIRMDRCGSRTLERTYDGLVCSNTFGFHINTPTFLGNCQYIHDTRFAPGGFRAGSPMALQLEAPWHGIAIGSPMALQLIPTNCDRVYEIIHRTRRHRN
jgi:hypothetical protein